MKQEQREVWVAAPISALFVAKCIGIFFAPLGAVLGYIGMF